MYSASGEAPDLRSRTHHLFQKEITPRCEAGGVISFKLSLVNPVGVYLFMASSMATATETVAPTMGLLPMPIRPIISTWAGTEEEPAN